MQPVELYIKPTCPYCQRAISLLDSKGAHYTLINLLQQPQKRDEMIERANGRTTVPQIFIGETHVGGFDDLNALEESGELDKLLAE
ncbi:MAG: glutaredoxin 3 [Cardiobacteriales bacterium]|nr:MAG: glutaredoxin 3 [Cardiobacteriales bacterium]